MIEQHFSFPSEQATQLTQEWVESMVVGLNLCPFAAPEVRNNAIRYVASHSDKLEVAVEDFLAELDLLQKTEEEAISTTLLTFTQVAVDFDMFLDLLDMCQRLLEQAGLEGVFQLASFHPDYCFEGVEPDDLSNWTNRAPFPTIHIIREGQMSRVLTHYKKPEEIPERNMALMESLGREGLIQHFPKLKRYWPES
ncbi:MAG: DUF1415 domain-containing protein [Neptuniibacter sp.]